MNNELKYIHEDFEPLRFNQITSIINNTQKNKNNIINNWNKIFDFIINNPDLEHLDEFGQEIKGNLSKVALKDEYILDSLVKIYRQVQRHPPFILNKVPTIDIMFYSYEPHIINRWKEENIKEGEFDSEGILNNGCPVLLRIVKIDWQNFLDSYSMEVN